MADETRASGPSPGPSDASYGRPVLVPALAVVAVGLAVAAVTLVDSPAVRLPMGVATLVCVLGCAVIWARAWGSRGGSLTVFGRVRDWLGEHASAVVLSLGGLAMAVAFAKGGSTWLVAPLAGLVAGTVMWRQEFALSFRIAGAVAMTLAVATQELTTWLTAVGVAVIAVFYLPVLVRGQTEILNAREDGKPAIGWRDVRSRYLRLLGRVLISLLLFVGAIGGLALVGGSAVRSANPSFELLTWSAVAIAVIVAAIICWWWRSYERVVLDRNEPGFLTGSLLGAVVVGVAIGALGAEAPQKERTDTAKTLAHHAARGQFDLVLVVDPGDPVGRALIARAKREVDTPIAVRDTTMIRGLFAPRIAGAPYDVEYGIAVPRAGDDGSPLRIVEPPTSNADELLDALAGLTPRRDPAPDALRRVARDGVGPRLVERWREDERRDVTRPAARRGVAFLLDRLPARPTELDATPRTGRVALYVLTRERRRSRITAWRSAALRTGGQLATRGARPPKPKRPASGETARTLLRDATDLHTGVPVGRLHAAAWKHRPVLLFDANVKDDPLRPVDVDWLLATQRPPPPARPNDVQKVCDRAGLNLTCDEISSADSLARSLDEFIDFSDAGRKAESPDPARMYVHARTVDGRVYLGYWWFIRYNSSPWRGEVNCLPGLSFGAISCHDHEGDWEGVTVVLDDELKPEAAVYDAHGREIRWDWEMLRRRDERPLVFVAVGSHASYPESCARSECDQKLGNEPIGDGGFDGEDEWPFNDEDACRGGDPTERTQGPCLVALPTVERGGRGVLWNAFLGRWGGAICTPYGRVCSQVNGPESPSQQERFRKPCTATHGETGELRAYRARRVRGARSPRTDVPHTKDSVISGPVTEWDCPEPSKKPAR